MTPSEEQQLRDACNSATPAPWPMPYRRGEANRVRVMRGTDDVGDDDGSMFAAGPEHAGPKYPETDAEVAALEAAEAAAMADAVFISMARSAVPALLAERDALRAIIADCAAAIGNGSSCTSRASVEFMAMIPAEIRAEVAALRVEVGKESALRAELTDEVRRLRARVDAVGQVLAANGCDCDCECVAGEHDDGCDRCLACRVQGAINGAATP